MKRQTIKFAGPCVETHYVGPTDHRGSRVAGKHLLTGKRALLGWRDELNVAENHERAARAVLQDQHSVLRYHGVNEGGYIWTRDRPWG
jgi:hypothetical protein